MVPLKHVGNLTILFSGKHWGSHFHNDWMQRAYGTKHQKHLPYMFCDSGQVSHFLCASTHVVVKQRQPGLAWLLMGEEMFVNECALNSQNLLQLCSRTLNKQALLWISKVCRTQLSL